MNIFRVFFELFVIYLLYKLVFEFIIPVYKTTSEMKSKMKEMHAKMQQQQNKSESKKNVTSTETGGSKKTFQDDYIEYEEVRK